MLSPSDLRKEIENRLRKYLARDKSGIRKALLSLFVRAKSLTVAQIHERLAEKFGVSYHSIASMVGTIASKLGILSTRRSSDGTIGVYEVKEQYVDVIERAIATAI
jgi:predicted transcriptional regulator